MIRSHRGEMIDMSALMTSNIDTIAVGNATMNARGDVVNKRGEIVKSRSEIVQDYYQSPNAVKESVSLNDIMGELNSIEVEKPKAVTKRKIVDKD